MKTKNRVAEDKAGIGPSQIARTATTLRLQVALDEAARAARAERIKRLREESPYTQPHIADFVGVSLRAYQRWEEGGGIEWEHLEKLAELHEVDPQQIHRGAGRGATPDPFASPHADQLDHIETMLEEVLERLPGDLASDLSDAEEAPSGVGQDTAGAEPGRSSKQSESGTA